MTDEERIHCMALTRIPGLGPIGARNLLQAMGSALSVFQQREQLPRLIPGVTPRLVEALHCPKAMERAEKELLFAQKNHIECLTLNETAYPSRLRECDDAPSVIYFRGNANLNSLRVISVVGTRHITEYGKLICRNFLNELHEQCPDVVIVSGLAYGVDIHAHRAALTNNLNTIAVLAHGLDRIYPSSHRSTAIELLLHGGLLTEYMSETNPDRQNFVKRNRIVAGISDATIVIESAIKGGALITADIAQSYARDCFTFPGRVNDEFSMGCNNLIKENRAALIQSADDFVKAMGWEKETSSAVPLPVQRQFFPDLSEEEQCLVNLLQQEGSQQINTLVVRANIPVNKLNAILFELEMKGVIRVLAGGMYQLLD